MASKKIEIEVGVKTDNIDKASQKLGQLKDLGRGLKIQYDIDGKPLDIVIDKSKNLQEQFKLVTRELKRTKEGTAEFALLAKTQSDISDGLARTKAKSGDLLTSLQLLPGPVGEFASKMNGAIALLKTFSSFSLKDLRFQFKETINDITDVIDNVFGLNKGLSDVSGKNVKAGVEATSGAINGLAEATTAGVAATVASTVAVKSNTTATKAQIDYIIARNAALGNYAGPITKQVLDATNGAAGSTNFFSAALTRLIAILTSAQAALLGIVTLIGVLGYKLYQYVTETTAAEEATKAFKDTLLKGATAAEEARNKVLEVGVAFEQAKTKTISKQKALETYNEVLGGTIGKAETLAEAEKLYNENTENYIKSVGLRAQAQELFRIAAEKSAQAITAQEVGFFSFDRRILESYDDELKRRRKNLSDVSTEIRKSATDLLKEAGTLKTGFKPQTETKKDDSAYQKRLSELDAQIQLEVNKEATRVVELTKLYDEKAKMIIDHDKLTYSQAELLRQENDKKVNDAINDDIKRRDTYLAKIDDLETQAITDAQKKEETARIQKLNQDINNLNFDEEFLRAGLEEQGKIRANLEAKYDQDILDIRDKYYQKKYKKEQDAFLKEQELRTKNKEQELQLNQSRIDKQNDFNTLYGDLIFGTKGLKAMYEKYFVDIRAAYQTEFENDMARYAADELALKTNLENKVITQTTYDEQIIQLNDKKAASTEKNAAKQIELDKLEVDSKRASADMTIQIGSNLVGLLSGIAGKNIKLQKAAALLDAGVSIARVITDTSRAIIAFSASVAPLGPAGIPIAAGYAVKAKISAGLAIATIIAQGIGKLNSLDEGSLTGEGGGGQGKSSTIQGMARGGMIGGKRHAEGGTIIEAEQGEAVLTRGAVSMFGPMLSMMNQAGGGVSFNSNLMTTRQDNPILSNPAQDQAPIVIKTYVVEKDMVSQMNKQARLKDLSTL